MYRPRRACCRISSNAPPNLEASICLGSKTTCRNGRIVVRLPQPLATPASPITQRRNPRNLEGFSSWVFFDAHRAQQPAEPFLRVHPPWATVTPASPTGSTSLSTVPAISRASANAMSRTATGWAANAEVPARAAVASAPAADDVARGRSLRDVRGLAQLDLLGGALVAHALARPLVHRGNLFALDVDHELDDVALVVVELKRELGGTGRPRGVRERGVAGLDDAVVPGVDVVDQEGELQVAGGAVGAVLARVSISSGITLWVSSTTTPTSFCRHTISRMLTISAITWWGRIPSQV